MENFYQKMNSFTDFNQLFDDKHYQQVPESWYVFLSDVRGSTKAVSEGKARDVNMVGALGITSVLNLTTEHLPFVFGGDGGTILVPYSLKHKAVEAFRKSIYVAKEMYGLELRAGFIAVKELVELGYKIDVAKYELSPNNYISQFKGKGLKIAEMLIKANPVYLLKPLEEHPNLDGLSCRWSPIQSSKGKILSIICQSNDESLIEKVIHGLESILNKKLKEASPVLVSSLKPKWPPRIDLETKANSSPKDYWKKYIKYYLINLIAYYITSRNKNIGKFNTLKYKQEMTLNSDYKKYDDALRLVIDCSPEEVTNIYNYLDKIQQKTDLLFGIQESNEAVMTCLVHSAENNQHIHFIDGGDGGYTMAAKKIKDYIATLQKAVA